MIVLIGIGLVFFCGGDICEFYDCLKEWGELFSFVCNIVGMFNEIFFRIVDQNVFFVCVFNGFIMGGLIGLMLVCDYVIVSEIVFVQFYYVCMGFVLDGGWIVMMLGCVGFGYICNWFSFDKCFDVWEMGYRGIVDDVCVFGVLVEYVECIIQ